MIDQSDVELTINLHDPDIDDDELDKRVQMLLNELKEMDEVDSVERVADPNPPKGSKSSGSFLLELLNLRVNPASCLRVITFLGDRLGNKPLRLKIKTPNGKEVELEANSREEFNYLLRQAQSLLQSS